MDLAPTQTDPLTTGTMTVLESSLDQPVVQHSSSMFQKKWTPYEERFDAPLNLTERTQWRRLDGSAEPGSFRGRLIGGCLDTIAWLAGTKYGDVPAYVDRNRRDGVILYFENVEMAPPGLVRALLALKRHGWFDRLAGLLIGRSAGPAPQSSDNLSYPEALVAALGGLDFPVIYDVDIGHLPPQFTLINGALAQVNFAGGKGSVAQGI